MAVVVGHHAVPEQAQIQLADIARVVEGLRSYLVAAGFYLGDALALLPCFSTFLEPNDERIPGVALRMTVYHGH